MGIYLSTPKTEKFSEDGQNGWVRYGLSSMQGWRATMEDAVSSKRLLDLFELPVLPCQSLGHIIFLYGSND